MRPMASSRLSKAGMSVREGVVMVAAPFQLTIVGCVQTLLTAQVRAPWGMQQCVGSALQAHRGIARWWSASREMVGSRMDLQSLSQHALNFPPPCCI